MINKFHSTIRSSTVDYRNQALSDEPDIVSFKILKSRKGGVNKVSSLNNRIEEGGDYENVNLEATTLDIVCAENASDNWVVWIDVEGAQNKVLAGGAQSLPRASMVLIEVEDREVWEGQWMKWDVDNYLINMGFLPVVRDF
jgi:FkbM family methyltransferase